MHVNGIGPGGFETDLTASLVADEKFSDRLTGCTPQRRRGEVSELAPAAVVPAGDAASFVDAHILYIDGDPTATL